MAYIFYISGNRNFLIFQERYIQNPGIMKLSYISVNLAFYPSISGSELFIFQEGTDKAPRANKKSATKKFLVSFDAFVIYTAVKHREIPCDYIYSAVNHREIPYDYLYSAVKHIEIPCDYLNVK